jgi:hypothetical protein
MNASTAKTRQTMIAVVWTRCRMASVVTRVGFDFPVLSFAPALSVFAMRVLGCS